MKKYGLIRQKLIYRVIVTLGDGEPLSRNHMNHDKHIVVERSFSV